MLMDRFLYRRLRFRVRTILVGTAIAALLLSVIVVPVVRDSSRARYQNNMAERINQLGGVAGLSYDILENEGFFSTLRCMVIGIKEMVTVSSVDFSGTDLTKKHLLLLKEVGDLEMLDLSDTELSDEHIEDLLEIQKLDVINVKRTQVTSIGIEKLKEKFPDLIIYH